MSAALPSSESLRPSSSGRPTSWLPRRQMAALGPLTFTSVRYVVASATLFLLVRWRLGPVRPPGRTALALVGLGMLGFGGYQLLWSTGLTEITAGDSALIVAVAPVLTALLAGVVGMDRLTPAEAGGGADRVRGRRRRGHRGRGAVARCVARRRRCSRWERPSCGRSTRSPAPGCCARSTRCRPPRGRSSAGPCSCSRSGPARLRPRRPPT